MRSFTSAAVLVLTAASVAACGTGSAGARPGGAGSAGQVTVTDRDSGATIRLHPGQAVTVVLAPRGMFSWHLPAADGTAVRRVSAAGGYPGPRPARAVFLASGRGSATISAIDDVACLHTSPACSVPQQTWRVTVLVS